MNSEVFAEFLEDLFLCHFKLLILLPIKAVFGQDFVKVLPVEVITETV